MKKYLGLILLLCTHGLYAWENPLSTMGIQRLFGADNKVSFSTGVYLEDPSSQEVRSMEQGTIVFTRDLDYTRVQVPWSGSRVVVVDHPGGYRALYGGLLEDQENWRQSTASPRPVTKGGILGSFFGNLYLQILDITQGQSINPLHFFSGIEDRRRPVIQEVLVQWTQEEESRPLLSRIEAPSESPILSIITRDIYTSPASEDVYQGLPYKLTCTVNGEVVFFYEALALRVFEGKRVFAMATKGGYASIYGESGAIELGPITLKAGLNTVVITVEDYQGNSASAAYRLTRPL